MKCSKCGQENPGDISNCTNCNAPLENTPGASPGNSVTVRVSRLAITAISLAFWGLIFLVISLVTAIRIPRPVDSTTPFYFIILNLSVITLILAIILGFVSYILIEKSGGRITGKNFAIGSILISIFCSILPVGLLILIVGGPKVNKKMFCGTNLSGIGKAMLLYANDYDYKFPNQNITWGTSVKWDAATQQEAYGINRDGTGGSATISSSLYLLVKYIEVTQKSFICKGDKKMSLFNPERYGIKDRNITEFWDFGPQPWLHNSYAYHLPYGGYPLATSSDPGMAVLADRNPWIPSPGWKAKDFSTFDPDGDKSIIRNGNSPCHNDEGQNVMYLDTHVDFESNSFCGINEDNIYTPWNGDDIRKGTKPQFGSSPIGRTDSLLLNDPMPQNP